MKQYRNTIISALTVAVVMLMHPLIGSAQNSSEQALVVLSRELPQLDGAHLKVSVVEVVYAPGGFSQQHSHPCPVIGYVAEGAIRYQVKGEKETVYKAGETEKYFRWSATATGLNWQRNLERIERDAALDGIYVLRTNVSVEHLDRDQTVLAYKRLATVERAFRSLKSVDLNVRPIHHRLPERVRAHVFLAMLAYYVEWHMRQALAPVLFDDEEHDEIRSSPVAPAVRSEKAQAKALRKRTEENWPVQSFQDWLKDLATIVKNTIQPQLKSLPTFEVITRPTPAQQHALQLLAAQL
jgi:Transposase DDE domain